MTSVFHSRSKIDVGEAQGEQVLHGLLAEVVVDAEGLRFGEHLADAIVDLARRGQVVADRLFQHHARVRRHQAGAAEIAADRAVQDRATWRDRTHARAPDRAIAAVRPSRHRVARVEARHSAGKRQKRSTAAGSRSAAATWSFSACTARWRKPSSPRSERAAPMMRESGGHLAVARPVVQRRQQLAQRQVAGGAEHHAVERPGPE